MSESEIDAFMDYFFDHEFSIPSSLRCIDDVHRSVPPWFRKAVRDLTPSFFDLPSEDAVEQSRVALFFDGMARRWLPAALEVAELPGHVELRALPPIEPRNIEAASSTLVGALKPLPTRGEDLPEALRPMGDRAGPPAPDGQPSRLGAVLQAMHAVRSARRASVELSERSVSASRSDYQVCRNAVECAYSASRSLWYATVGRQDPVDDLWRDVLRVIREASTVRE